MTKNNKQNCKCRVCGKSAKNHGRQPDKAGGHGFIHSCLATTLPPFDIDGKISGLLAEQRKKIIKDIEGMGEEHPEFCYKKGKQYKKCCACILEDVIKKLQ